jgi:hypothetical protein
MIKALLLIFSSAATWQRISETPRKWGVVLFVYLLPMLLLVSAAEGYGLTQWGKLRGELTKLTQFSIPQAEVYEAAQLILSLAIVFIAAGLIKSFGETFHGRHNFSQTFTVAAYGLSPVFLLRLLNAFPAVSPWASWGIGITLTISILYSGIPLVMRPDPPHALGLYLMTSMFLFMITGLTSFFSDWYLKGKFPKLDVLVSHYLK